MGVADPPSPLISQSQSAYPSTPLINKSIILPPPPFRDHYSHMSYCLNIKSDQPEYDQNKT